MTRVVAHSNISTPAARARLRPRPKPFWQAFDPGLYLGYRRGAVGGKWCVRVYGSDGHYKLKSFAIADDHVAADGERVMSFAQAKRAAFGMAASPAPGPLTVADALHDYFERLEQKERPVKEPRRRVEMHVLPTLGAVPVDALTRETLDEWLAGVARGRDDAGPTRALKASANRTATILRAALNQAFRDDKCASDKAWRSCAPFKSVDAPRERFFTQEANCGPS